MTKQLQIREGLNVNTILITIVLAISAWTLKKISDTGEQVAVNTSRLVEHERRLTVVEAQVR